MTNERIGRQTPTSSVVIPYTETKGPEASELYAESGKTLIEWQELILDDIMALNEEGLWAHQKYGYSVPRRNGKSEDVLARCLWGLKNGERILYTAHRTSTAHAIWERLERMSEKAGIEITSSYKAHGKEHLFTESGIIEFRTRTSSGGLGEGYDLLIIDEAQEYTDAQETALKYVVTDSPNPQTIMLGTPPTAVSAGTVFTKYREKVLTGAGYDSGWSEWSVEEMTDPENTDMWYETNPSMGFVLNERKVRAEITSDDIDFNIQRLGLWLRYSQKSAISENEWDALQFKKTPKIQKSIYAGVKYGVDGNFVSLSLAVKTVKGEIFVEAFDCQSVRAGEKWLVDAILKIKPVQVAIDGQSRQQILARELKRNGYKHVVLPTVGEVITANAVFEQALFDGSIVHGDQPSLRRVVGNCEKRAIGAKGGFGYKAQRDDIEISLLDSLIFAHWLCAEAKEKRKQTCYY